MPHILWYDFLVLYKDGFFILPLEKPIIPKNVRPFCRLDSIKVCMLWNLLW